MSLPATSSLSASSTCKFCGLSGKCLLCGGCRQAWYCSRECQRRDRQAHRARCQSILSVSSSAQVSITVSEQGEGCEDAEEPWPPTSAGRVGDFDESAYLVSLPYALNNAVEDMAKAWASHRPAPEDSEIHLEACPMEKDAQAATDNAQISELLLRKRNLAEQLCLFEFTRDPQSFHTALKNCPQLQACGATLQLAGFNVDLASGAKAFVRPEQFEPMCEAIRLAGWDLKPRHVFVSMELEDVLLCAVKKVPRQEKVRRKRAVAAKVPLGFASAIVENELPADVVRTFIHIKTPNSLRSEPTTGPVTKSTTDAKDGRNPRKS